MRPSLHDAWWRLATQHHPQTSSQALIARVLQAGSSVYQAAITVRNAAYDRGWCTPVRLPCRVVSVGNLTVGGSGKTACVELVVEKLARLGRRVAILSRGYGGRRRTYWLQSEAGRLQIDGRDSGDGVAGQELCLDSARHSSLDKIETIPSKAEGRVEGSSRVRQSRVPRLRSGLGTERSRTCRVEGLADEPQLLAARLPGVPVVVGASRARTGWFACDTLKADTVVLDDAFQHRGVHRDCDVVLVHARTPFGGWALLPRGPMREPMDSLRRADLVIVTKADDAPEIVAAWREQVRALAPQADVVTATHEPSGLLDPLSGQAQDLNRLSGMRVGLLSSIGDPAGFEATVQRLGAMIAWHQTFPDHHRYQARDWQKVAERVAGASPDAVLTTEKDWVRLRPLLTSAPPRGVPLWVLGIRMKILSGEDALDDRLARLSPC